MIAHDMDRRLLERTVELAKKTGGFDFKKLPKTVRLAVDSRPLTGAGRVEHRLAHHAGKQGTRTHYISVRKNVCDARRYAATVNLERLQAAQAT